MSYAKKLYKVFQSHEPKSLIKKLHTKFECYEIEGEFVISTVTHKVEENAYVVSPYTLIIGYSQDELLKIESKLQRAFSAFLIRLFAGFLKFSQLDKVQTLNNYLFTTNTFRQKWESLDIDELSREALKKYPNHALLFRSVNQVQNPKLFKNLRDNGYLGMVIRQVYLLRDQEQWASKRDVKKDKKLLDSARFEFSEIGDEFQEYPKLEALYNSLYLDKYSQHNIQYSAKYLKILVEQGLLRIYLLREREQKNIVGFVGFTLEEQTMTIPLVGYEPDYPQKDALYRRLMIFSSSYAMEHNYLLNFSSGAPKFKRTRGAEPHLEYLFVKTEHLKFSQRVSWKLLSWLSKYFYVPMLERLEL